MPDNITPTPENELDAAETAITITERALQMDAVGAKFRAYYIGLKPGWKVNQQTGEMIAIKIARFFRESALWTNMGAQLVRVCADLEPGLPVEVELRELRPNKQGGKTKIYGVTVLKMPPLDVHALFQGITRVIENTPPEIVAAVEAAQLAAPAQEPEAGPPTTPALSQYAALYDAACRLGLTGIEPPEAVAGFDEGELAECNVIIKGRLQAEYEKAQQALFGE